MNINPTHLTLVTFIDRGMIPAEPENIFIGGDIPNPRYEFEALNLSFEGSKVRVLPLDVLFSLILFMVSPR